MYNYILLNYWQPTKVASSPGSPQKMKNKNQMRMLTVFLFLYYHYLLSGVASEFTPVVTAPVVYTTSSSQCGQYDPLQDEQLMEALQEAKEQLPKQPSLMINNSSCKSIRDSNPSAPSGFYQINSTNGSLVQVYCDMEGTSCGGEGGWTRVAFVNMTKPGAACPQGLDQAMFDGSRTVVGSRTVQLVVCLQLLIISSAIKRCVEEFLDISKIV